MDGTSIAVQFGALVRRFRKEKELSQEEFAEECGLHRTYIGAIERGEKTVSIETASKIASALDLPLWKLFKQLGD